jgi:hypothetical protein
MNKKCNLNSKDCVLIEIKHKSKSKNELLWEQKLL